MQITSFVYAFIFFFTHFYWKKIEALLLRTFVWMHTTVLVGEDVQLLGDRNICLWYDFNRSSPQVLMAFLLGMGTWLAEL
jgi:hypothetical protein